MNEYNKENNDLESYYEEQLSMFTSQGWKDFIEQVETIVSANTIDAVNSEKELFLTKGRLDILRWILSWENLVRTAMEQNEISL
jgi:hypothetical protein